MPSKKAIEKALAQEREIQELQLQIEEDKMWKDGVDERGKKREEKLNQKYDEKMRKNREMRVLLGNDDLKQSRFDERPKSRRGRRETNELEDELKNRPVTNTGRILKEKQREMDADNFKKLLEDNKREEERERKKEEEQEYNKRGIVSNQKLFITIDNNNVFEEKSIYDASNIEDAVNIFNDDLPNVNVLYKDFYERNLPIVKNELPGMRLNQYKEKIKKMWKISYENPKNNNH